MVRKKIVKLVACLLMAFLLPLSSKVYGAAFNNAEVFETGQTSCWDSSGNTNNTILCTNTGQDGAILAGVSWPTSRFTNNGDSTITDGLTGLMWTRDGSTLDSTCTASAGCNVGGCSWLQAKAYVACLNTNSYLCYTDWRLPNRAELTSLVNFQQSNVATWLNTPTQPGFTNVQSSNFYWSSSTYASNPSSAWIVSMNEAVVDYGNKSNSYYVWPVRAGKSGPYNSLDISVTQSGTSPVLPNGSVTYTVTVANNDNTNMATGVYLIDSLPAGATYGSATPSTGACCQSGGLLKCNIGALAHNVSATITVQVTAPSSAGTITNTVNVTTKSKDTNAANNTHSFNTTVDTPTPSPTPTPTPSPTPTPATTDSVTYRFPYFHTAVANMVYCVASNFTGQAATVSFQPKAGGAYNSSKFTSISLGTLKANGVNMFTFNGNTATSSVGGANATISGPDSNPSANGAMYGADLSFSASTIGTLNCSTIFVGCFQGGMGGTVKRNLFGYVCFDSNGGFSSY